MSPVRGAVALLKVIELAPVRVRELAPAPPLTEPAAPIVIVAFWPTMPAPAAPFGVPVPPAPPVPPVTAALIVTDEFVRTSPAPPLPPLPPGPVTEFPPL